MFPERTDAYPENIDVFDVCENNGGGCNMCWGDTTEDLVEWDDLDDES